MNNEIEKSEQSSPDDVLAAIQSFNDPSIITNIFQKLGWSYSLEIKETLIMAKQNANLPIKFKAIKHLRELLREAAETSGYVASVSSTVPNPQGGHTTFSAKRIAGILNPVKKIESTEIKETQNDEKEIRTEPDRGSDRRQSEGKSKEEIPQRNNEGFRKSDAIPEGESDQTNSTESIRDTRRAFPAGDADSGGTESADGGETPRPIPGGAASDREGMLTTDDTSDNNAGEGDTNPCIKTRPPTCDQDLFPGITSAEGNNS